jgi:predicted Rossmann fold nucleotide-binding protein DprA/Smf involved in DNA uptake
MLERSKHMSVIEEARDLLQSRLDEVQDEAKIIERSLKGLAATNGHAARRRLRPKGGGTNTAKRLPAATRRKRSGTRAEEAVSLVSKAGKDGISASDIAKAMKIKPNYLYRVMGDLEKEGRIKKDGRTYFPVG